jgi:hypothetical protein
VIKFVSNLCKIIDCLMVVQFKKKLLLQYDWSSSCSTSGTRRVSLVTNPVISHERGKDREVLTTSGTYPWSFVTQIFHNGQPSHSSDRKTFEVMTSTLPKGTLGSVASLLAATLYQGNPDRNHKPWIIVSMGRYILHMLKYCQKWHNTPIINHSPNPHVHVYTVYYYFFCSIPQV